MAHLCASMLPAVQLAAADVLADEALAAALQIALFLAAVASHLDIDLALLTLSLMASLLALVLHAVEKPLAGAFACVHTPGCNRARDAL